MTVNYAVLQAGSLERRIAALEAEIERFKECNADLEVANYLMQTYVVPDNKRLRTKNAELKAEMQKLYDNWVRVLKLAKEDE